MNFFTKDCQIDEIIDLNNSKGNKIFITINNPNLFYDGKQQEITYTIIMYLKIYGSLDGVDFYPISGYGLNNINIKENNPRYIKFNIDTEHIKERNININKIETLIFTANIKIGYCIGYNFL